MATFTISATITATSGEITKVIQGLEMNSARVNGETDLQYAKRVLLIEPIKLAYKRKKDADTITAALAANPVDIDVS